MKEWTEEELREAVAGALKLLEKRSQPDSVESILAAAKLAGEQERAEKCLIKTPENTCDHGVVFDLEAAKKILEETPEEKYTDPAMAFIMGPVNGVAKIKKLWPRLCGKCPKGCGFEGIAYASYEHYIYGDW